MNRQAALLLLADGRLPAGGYAHSGGLEPAVTAGRVADMAGLESFLIGRAETAGLITAAFAAAACACAGRGDLSDLPALEVELDARTPSPELRKVSHDLGRQKRRAMNSIHPHLNFAVVGTTSRGWRWRRAGRGRWAVTITLWMCMWARAALWCCRRSR
ncbi:urease accessory UreF family protein [uncultured Aliiroseovarius sp.]|uniref:urease accessory protein UreF n=1 Tax=uncultured Aliiroseovarius sp. TaxID=1658783 RepID=UPI002595EF5F|nr:urease accessory UreF family protein [uncultured Aliiroseovarius sp.]